MNFSIHSIKLHTMSLTEKEIERQLITECYVSDEFDIIEAEYADYSDNGKSWPPVEDDFDFDFNHSDRKLKMYYMLSSNKGNHYTTPIDISCLCEPIKDDKQN